MSLTLIKAALEAQEATIAGVKAAYTALPRVGPQPPDLPAIINMPAQPFLTLNFVSIAEAYYQWNFDIMLLYKTVGEETVQDWDAGLEPWPVLFITKMFSSLTLGGKCTDQNWRGQPKIIWNYPYLSDIYVAWQFPWVIEELVSTPVVP